MDLHNIKKKKEEKEISYIQIQKAKRDPISLVCHVKYK